MESNLVRPRVSKNPPFPLNEEIKVIFPGMKNARKGVIKYDEESSSYVFYMLKNGQYKVYRQLSNAGGHFHMPIWTSDNELWSCFL